MTILCYHEVHPTWTSEVSITPELFDRHIRWLARHRSVVDLDTALGSLDRRMRLPRGRVALTFDDGFEGVYHHALPVLRELGMPATVFLVAGTLVPEGREVDWVVDPGNHRPVTLTVEQVREMRVAGIRFGSHGLSHRLLPELDDTECLDELTRSRGILEDILREPVDLFAYPAGRHDARVRRLVEQAGYRYAFSLPEGREEVDRFAVARAGMYAGNDVGTLRIKASPWFPPARAVVRVLRRRSQGASA